MMDNLRQKLIPHNVIIPCHKQTASPSSIVYGFSSASPNRKLQYQSTTFQYVTTHILPTHLPTHTPPYHPYPRKRRSKPPKHLYSPSSPINPPYLLPTHSNPNHLNSIDSDHHTRTPHAHRHTRTRTHTDTHTHTDTQTHRHAHAHQHPSSKPKPNPNVRPCLHPRRPRLLPQPRRQQQ